MTLKRGATLIWPLRDLLQAPVKNLKLKNTEHNICDNIRISIFHVTDYNLKLNMGRNLGLWIVMADVPTPKMFNAFVVECMSLLRML